MLKRGSLLLVALVLVFALAGCGSIIPADPDGTLDRVTDGVLRVGASPDNGLMSVGGNEVSGEEAELVEDFAETLNARVEWTIGGEEHLVGQLDTGKLDLVVGGITDATPWVESAGVTRSYPAMPGADGRKIVMLVPLGENQFLSTLERFLDAAVGE